MPRLRCRDPRRLARRPRAVGLWPSAPCRGVLGKILERLPYRTLVDRLAARGATMSTATVQRLVWAASDRLGGTYAAIVRRLRRAAAVHADETTFLVDGRRWWLWPFTTVAGDVLVVLRPSRGAAVVDEVLGPAFEGVVVCDGWKAYLGHELQRCGAHLLRVARAAIEEVEG
jgi:hypothetical protein